VRAKLQAELRVEFGPTDPGLTLAIEPVPAGAPAHPLRAEDTEAVIGLLLATPTGVIAMDRDIAGLVETSTNLGVVETNGDTVAFVNCSRSSIGSAREAVSQSLRALGEGFGAKVSLEGAYPGWKPNVSSKLLSTFKAVHQLVTGNPVKVMAVHAGLECGILGERFPGMDMISFGPDLKGVHAPGEKLHIGSTQRFFDLLKALLVVLAGGKVAKGAAKPRAGAKTAAKRAAKPRAGAKTAAKRAAKPKPGRKTATAKPAKRGKKTTRKAGRRR
jgi:dipeptidase D